LFSTSPDKEVPHLRRRIINAKYFNNEVEQWRNWHKEQSDAEREIRGWN
jgi:hypothetical protein